MESVSRDPEVAVVDIAAWLRLILPPEPDAVFEVRVPNCPHRAGDSFTSTWAGYFQVKDIDQAAEQIARIDHDQQPAGIYVTLNPVSPDLLARAHNTIKPKMKDATGDEKILRRRWLVIDLDPKRPSGISATKAEMAAALGRAEAIRTQLTTEGWPLPIRCASGNGAYLLYPIDLPNDTDSKGLLQRVLAGFKARFQDEVVEVDQTMFNASRIVKVMGTHARKGVHLVGVQGVEDRPHRLAQYLEVPTLPQIVPVERLEQMAAAAGAARPAPSPKPAASRGAGGDTRFARFDHTPEGVREYLEQHGVAVARTQTTADGTKLILERCPITDIDGTNTSVAVIVRNDGLVTFNNLHNRGAGLTWIDLREQLEPGYRAWRASRPEAGASHTPDHPVDAPAPIRTLDLDLVEATTWMAGQHGKKALGLLTGTLPRLDERTMGLRGLILLASLPGIGKTSFGLQVGLDTVAYAHQQPDPHLGRVCFVFFSFEMSRRAMTLRVLSRASGLRWATLVLGERPPHTYTPDPDDGLVFGSRNRQDYAKGRDDLALISDRIVLIDGEDAPREGLHQPSSWLLERIAAAKAATQADHAFVLIDNLQAIPVWNDPASGHAWRTDLDRDRFVMSELLRVSRGIVPDPVMVISEQTKAGFGGAEMATVLGSGRSVYSPDVVMFLRPDPGLEDAAPDTPDTTRLDLVVVKARDGMTRGGIPLTFNHHISAYTEDHSRRPFTATPRKKSSKPGR